MSFDDDDRMPTEAELRAIEEGKELVMLDKDEEETPLDTPATRQERLEKHAKRIEEELQALKKQKEAVRQAQAEEAEGENSEEQRINLPPVSPPAKPRSPRAPHFSSRRPISAQAQKAAMEAMARLRQQGVIR